MTCGVGQLVGPLACGLRRVGERLCGLACRGRYLVADIGNRVGDAVAHVGCGIADVGGCIGHAVAHLAGRARRLVAQFICGIRCLVTQVIGSLRQFVLRIVGSTRNAVPSLTRAVTQVIRCAADLCTGLIKRRTAARTQRRVHAESVRWGHAVPPVREHQPSQPNADQCQRQRLVLGRLPQTDEILFCTVIAGIFDAAIQQLTRLQTLLDCKQRFVEPTAREFNLALNLFRAFVVVVPVVVSAVVTNADVVSPIVWVLVVVTHCTCSLTS